jgi:multiple sugar transport system substrate-binding protein
MATLTRRSVIRSSAALAAAGTLARPYLANAAATTAEVWWAQGFVQEEDVAFKKVVADYEKASGNKIDLSITPFAPQRQKIVAAMQSGIVPDLFPNNPGECIALYAWDDKLVEVTDVVATQREEYTERPRCLTSIATIALRRSAISTASPLRLMCSPTMSGGRWSRRRATRSRTSRRPGMPITISSRTCRRNCAPRAYGLGLNVTTNGVDPNNVFNYFVIAYGGQNIVSKDGKLHLDDPKVKEAVIKAMTYPATAYKEGFVPPSAINWNDADDNNAFHAKQIVMDLDGTISTEVAVLSQGKKDDYDDIVTMGLALSNEGKPVPSLAGSYSGLIPKGAKNVTVAKEFLKFLIQPKVVGELLKTGLGRRAPAMPSIVKDDPWWTDPKDPHVAAQTQQAVLGPTLPQFWVYNPAYAQVQNEHTFMTGWMDIIQSGMTPQAAAVKAFKRVEEIFAKYPIVQG